MKSSDFNAARPNDPLLVFMLVAIILAVAASFALRLTAGQPPRARAAEDPPTTLRHPHTQPATTPAKQ